MVWGSQAGSTYLPGMGVGEELHESWGVASNLEPSPHKVLNEGLAHAIDRYNEHADRPSDLGVLESESAGTRVESSAFQPAGSLAKIHPPIFAYSS